MIPYIIKVIRFRICMNKIELKCIIMYYNVFHLWCLLLSWPLGLEVVLFLCRSPSTQGQCAQH